MKAIDWKALCQLWTLTFWTKTTNSVLPGFSLNLCAAVHFPTELFFAWQKRASFNVLEVVSVIEMWLLSHIHQAMVIAYPAIQSIKFDGVVGSWKVQEQPPLAFPLRSKTCMLFWMESTEVQSNAQLCKLIDVYYREKLYQHEHLAILQPFDQQVLKLNTGQTVAL